MHLQMRHNRSSLLFMHLCFHSVHFRSCRDIARFADAVLRNRRYIIGASSPIPNFPRLEVPIGAVARPGLRPQRISDSGPRGRWKARWELSREDLRCSSNWNKRWTMWRSLDKSTDLHLFWYDCDRPRCILYRGFQKKSQIILAYFAAKC